MAVAGDQTIAVVNFDGPAICAVRTGAANAPAGAGEYRRTVRRGVIEAGVPGKLPSERIGPAAEA